MRAWAIVLGVAAGFGPVAEEAFADRGRRSHSSAQQHRPHHHQARPQYHHRPNHARPHSHHHHRHWRSPGIVVAPAFGAYYYAPGYFYSPPLVETPPVVATPPAVHPSNGDGYWYFCPDSRAYYPYVLECPSQWMRVVPN